MTAARSYLFVPGDRPERFDKACAAGADVVILDLEDAVAPNDRAAARAAIDAWLRPGRQVALRINSAQDDGFDADLALCAAPGVTAVMLPKAERVIDLQRVVAAAPAAALLPLIETAAGFAAIGILARAQGVQRLAFGTIDFQLDLGITGDTDELLYFRSHLVLASRLAGLQAPIDGVSTALDDAAQLQTDTARARRLGFGAKLCIHPKQLAIVHAGFAASAAELAWARRVVEAADAAQGGAIAVDGRMVDRPVVLRARALLGEAQQRDATRRWSSEAA